MLVRASVSSPAPLISPCALAVTTVPLPVAPRGIADFPPTLTGCASVATKVCPSWLVLELSAWPTRTVRVVPDGTIIGCGGGSAGAPVTPVRRLVRAQARPRSDHPLRLHPALPGRSV